MQKVPIFQARRHFHLTFNKLSYADISFEKHVQFFMKRKKCTHRLEESALTNLKKVHLYSKIYPEGD